MVEPIKPERNEEVLQRVRDHLLKKDVQERLQNSMRNAYSNMTVSISLAAKLFKFNEQQLRDWEKRGLLKAERSSLYSSKEEGKNTPGGHRQFSRSELGKLAIIKELIDEADLAPSEIPTTIEDIWYSIKVLDDKYSEEEEIGQTSKNVENQDKYLPINQRIENARETLFWREFVSQLLRFSILLIKEDNPGFSIGLLLPLHPINSISAVHNVESLYTVGESLIGWLSRSLSPQTLFTPIPSFQYPSEWKVVHLYAMKAGVPIENAPSDNTLIIVPRGKFLSLSSEVVETIRLLLTPLYKNVNRSKSCFGFALRDVLNPSPDLSNSEIYPDIILHGYADEIVRVGGRSNDQDRWRFCCILSPDAPDLPLQQRSLVVRAQSKEAPHKVGTIVPPDKDEVIGLSLRAFQSGRVIYRPIVYPEDSTIAFYDTEQPLHSAIAVPVGAENGEPIAVIYVASHEQEAFSEKHRRVLRLMARMVGELLRTYNVRRHEAENLSKILQLPDAVDELFASFPSETDFIYDIENLVREFKNNILVQEEETLGLEDLAIDIGSSNLETPLLPDILSVIAIDIDDLGSLVTKYGDQLGRNLSRELGARIKGDLESMFQKYQGYNFYHIFGDRYYVLLKNVPFVQIREKARLLKESLDRFYKVSIRQINIARPSSPRTMEDIKITVRLAVSSYSFESLKDILHSFSTDSDTTVETKFRLMLEHSLVTELKKGMAQGGNVIMSYNPEVRRYEQLPAKENTKEG